MILDIEVAFVLKTRTDTVVPPCVQLRNTLASAEQRVTICQPHLNRHVLLRPKVHGMIHATDPNYAVEVVLVCS